MNKIESMQKKALQQLYNDFQSNFTQLLDKAKESTMTIVRLLWLCLEIYKTINRLNPLMTMFLSYKNQSVHLLCKPTNWFLHDGHIGSSRVNSTFMTDISKLLDS